MAVRWRRRYGTKWMTQQALVDDRMKEVSVENVLPSGSKRARTARHPERASFRGVASPPPNGEETVKEGNERAITIYNDSTATSTIAVGCSVIGEETVAEGVAESERAVEVARHLEQASLRGGPSSSPNGEKTSVEGVEESTREAGDC
jgi:hypothetical protein